MSGCHGNGPDHCCYVDGQVCRWLEENTEPDRRWTCGLRRRLGSWEAVHADPRYQEFPGAIWRESGTVDCGDFGPAELQCCWGYWEDPDRPVTLVAVPGLGKPARPRKGRRRV
jgi:hypothetical protein